MHTVVKRLNLVKNKVKEIINKKQLKTIPQIVAVSKTFSLKEIIPLLEMGHSHFGENKIQEAENKWIDVKNKYQDLQLHMVGKLQSNKVKRAIKLFDYIHSLDNTKLAQKLCQYEKELNKKMKLFIQVNISGENQMSGISLNDLDKFHNYCTKKLSLHVIGLMSLPPINDDPTKHFIMLKNLAEKKNLQFLSMGMSTDYKKALMLGATHIRIGTLLFGSR